MQLQSFEPSNDRHLRDAVRVWNQACGADLAISEKLVAYNTGGTAVACAGRLAYAGDQPAGFVLASHRAGEQMGRIEAVAVDPVHQRCGIGTVLMDWAESWLAERGFAVVLLGGGYRPFVPGLPVELDTRAFFTRRGYRGEEADVIYDVAHDLSAYAFDCPPLRDGEEVRPLKTGEERALLDFLAREFPDRWHFEASDYLAAGGRSEEFIVVWAEGGVKAFAWTTTEDSLRPIERFYPYRLPRPWGQFGPLGVSADSRGKGYGAAVIDGAARHLRAQGVRGCVIDWTDLLVFYEKFGFRAYRAYAELTKSLE